MRRFSKVLIVALGLIVITAQPSLASSPHFKKGGSPACTITSSGSSASVTCSASLSGLGGGDLEIDLTVSGFAVYQCQNPSTKQTPPGQNRVLVGPVTAPTTIPADQIKNGNVSFTTNPAVLTAPTTVSGTAAGCNNDKWTGVNPTLTVTDILLTIDQPAGNRLFTCSASDSNGLTGTVALTCTSP